MDKCMIKKRLSILACVCSIIALTQTGCINMASTGAQAIYNHRSLQRNFSDQYITYTAYKDLSTKLTNYKDSNISISTFNGEVLLAGQVPSLIVKQQATAIVKRIQDVKEVHNLLEIASPSSTLTKMSDAWLTTKIKSKLIASNDVDATQIKVVSENGVVYLMGVLPPDEAQAATQIAAETDGVLSVVKIFSYIKVSKTLT